MQSVIAAALIVLSPLLVGALLRRVAGLRWLGPVVVCYGAGIALGRIWPAAVEIAGPLSEGLIPIAIPLLLFEVDVRAGLRASRPTARGFALAVVAAAGGATAGFFLFAERLPGAADAAGMLAGVYTGGTPNLLSVGAALGVDESVFVLLNGADLIASAVYLLILLTVARPALVRFLPPPVDADPPAEAAVDDARVARPRDVMLAVLLAVAIVGISAGLTRLAFGSLAVAPIILGLTTGALVAGSLPAVRRLSGSAMAGDHLVLAFCVAIGLRTDLGAVWAGGGVYLAFTATVLAVTVTLHLIGGRLFRVDADALIISSTAAVFGPPFVPLVARHLGAERLMLGGIAAGLLGYALGNYLGLSLAWALG